MTTILSLNDWFEVVRRGTSGDQVIDILYSWKEQSEKKDAELEKDIEGLKKMLAYIRDYSDEGIDEDLNGWSRVKQIQMLAQQALNEVKNSKTDYKEHLLNIPENEYRRLHEGRWENDEIERQAAEIGRCIKEIEKFGSVAKCVLPHNTPEFMDYFLSKFKEFDDFHTDLTNGKKED